MRLGVAVDDVLEVADAAGEVRCGPATTPHLGRILLGPQRLTPAAGTDREHDVDGDDGAFDLPLDGDNSAPRLVCDARITSAALKPPIRMSANRASRLLRSNRS